MENELKNITNFKIKSPVSRIKQIEDKLQYIADARTIQSKDQFTNSFNHKILNIQKHSSQLLRKVEQKSEQKQLLKQLTREYEQKSSKQQLSKRNRIVYQHTQDIAAGKDLITKKSQQSERKIILNYEEKIQELRCAIAKEVQKRKKYFQTLDSSLSQQLPGLQLRVSSQMFQPLHKLNKLQQQISNEVKQIYDKIKRCKQSRQQKYIQLIKIINTLVMELKQQINEQKEKRQKSKKNILILLQNTYGKLSN